jgi:putative adenylate-forming enzyme
MENPDRAGRIQDAMRAYGAWCEMKAREGWSREQLREYQSRQLALLVRHACERSPFYRELYKGIDLEAPVRLQDLPIVSKKVLMENFDRVVTDPKVDLASLYSHIDSIREDVLYAGQYRVLTTAGTSGFKGVFLYDDLTWSTLLAAVMRVGSFMGLSPLRPLRITAIGGTSPVHLSVRRAEAMNFGLHKVQRLVVTDPVEQLVAAMNSFQPHYIHAYPSIATLLAEEQLEGRLNIQPEFLLTGAELVTERMRGTIREAWGITPFESYSSTEGMLAAECGCHRGLHIFEDLLIAEVVDAEYRPVPDGTPGAKILLTNFFQYSEPLIRYEISDMITIDPEPCACGRPFRLIKAISGRLDDVFYLEGLSGESVPFHPMNFHFFLTTFPGIKEYRVILDDDGITVAVVPRDEWGEADEVELRRIFNGKFAEMKVRPPAFRIRRVDSIKRDGRFMGKLVVIEKGKKAPAG